MPAKVVVPSGSRHRQKVAKNKASRAYVVQAIVSNRVKDGVRTPSNFTTLVDEQFLVLWRTESKTTHPPLSWHLINELRSCLEFVQIYLEEDLEEREQLRRKSQTQIVIPSRKRKTPDVGYEIERRPSPFDRQLQQADQTPPTSRSSSVSINASSTLAPTPDVYNGLLEKDEHGIVFCRPASGPDVVSISLSTLLTPEMKQEALRADVKTAHTLIRAAYVQKLTKVPGPPVTLINTVDATTPSLRFRFIDNYKLTEGTYQPPPEAAEGCTQCPPRGPRNIGCEYTQKCECLELAAVDEGRLKDEEQSRYERCLAEGLSTLGLPKKFPYFTEGTKVNHAGALVPFYLNSRNPIYECNENCKCGPHCRNKNVQFGRKVKLEIFKTGSGRGWGLRCNEPLHQGQFIDTYRGEIITDEEATRREENSSKAKGSYLYSLDKFLGTEEFEHEPYVVDGEFMGGPSKFMNHSCEPNCRQYTVSYNKSNIYIYDIALFACRDIGAGEELTFDYLDKEDDGEEVEEPELGSDSILCLCGSSKCRKWLWR
ncbi:hypothetical protein E8E13_001524 [Curvularia kusanoi]|uniref:SET domain-containing protein n=1 Tax=Curvularia kusanoi TaxID=90978 RepID=A0A9P4W5Y1_CURKU|nr:hypothetical protein E8E13_001524 [Curvularia kusanoi]